MRWSDATYLEDQDMWRLSGIHRPVELLCKPAVHISDFSVTTPLVFAPTAEPLKPSPAGSAVGVQGSAGPAPVRGGLVSARLQVTVHLTAPTPEALTGG